MIRTALALLVVLALSVVAIALTQDAGTAEMTWLHWNVRTTAAAAILHGNSQTVVRALAVVELDLGEHLLIALGLQ